MIVVVDMTIVGVQKKVTKPTEIMNEPTNHP